MDKQCVNCQEIKSINEFYVNKQNKDGHSGQCKDCVKSYAATVRKKRMEDKPSKTKPLPKSKMEQAFALKEKYNSERVPIDGKICTVCGEWKPAGEYRANKYRKDGLWNFCKTCFNKRYGERRREQGREYEKSEHGKAVKKAWRGNNRDKVNSYNYGWRKRRPELYRAMIQRCWKNRVKRLGRDFVNKIHGDYLKSNPDKNHEYHRRYFLKNKEKCYAKSREWDKNHPESGQVRSQRRRARLNGNGGTFTKEEWLNLCSTYDNKCLCCGNTLPLTIDHVIPISVGGKSDITNLQPLCRPCNSSKGVKIIDYRF